MMRNLKGQFALVLLSTVLCVSPLVADDSSAGNDVAYKQQLADLSTQISAKISAIQAKQKQLDQEIYPASRPPLQAELDQLNTDLQVLQMKRDQLQSTKTAIDLTQQLKNPSQGQGAGTSQ
jgi:hypothetical protein